MSDFPGIIVQAIKVIPKEEWRKFFEAREIATAMRIAGTAPSELGALQMAVKELQALKNQFLEAHDTKTTL